MRLGYFTMPLHPLERDPTETLHEDRQTIIYADQLGFYDAFVGEHLTDKAENVTNSLIFQASLIADTRQIKLGSGTSNLSHSHPTLIASQAAMFDHLAKGRAAGLLGCFDIHIFLRHRKALRRRVVFQQLQLSRNRESLLFLLLGGNTGINDGLLPIRMLPRASD